MADEQRFFHWCVEFPEVFAANKGFDVMCGNPPWDKLQMEEEKWFTGKNNDIVKAANQADRKRRFHNSKRKTLICIKSFKRLAMPL